MSIPTPRAALAALLPVFVFSLACAGLEPDVGGTLLAIDGEAWTATACQSGEVFGFEGVQLEGADGRRVRLHVQPDGKAEVIVMQAGQTTGTSLGACAEVAFERTGLTINDVVALEGGGQVACTGGEVSVEGEVAVSNCATPLF